MKNLMARILLSVVVTVAALAFAAPSPAHADAPSYHSCVSGSVCLYQWVGFTGPNGPAKRWQSSFSNIWQPSGHAGCLTLSPAVWPNGTPVSANSAGFVSNPAGTFSGPDWVLSFYLADGCVGTRATVTMTQEVETSHMGAPWYHGIRSIGLTLLV